MKPLLVLSPVTVHGLELQLRPSRTQHANNTSVILWKFSRRNKWGGYKSADDITVTL